jgi:ribosomal protein S12 methylthiotransferase
VVLTTSSGGIFPFYYPRRPSSIIRDGPHKNHVGCSNHCIYCAIPHIRGELRSRDSRDMSPKRGPWSIGCVRARPGRQDLGNYGSATAGRCMLPELLGSLERSRELRWRVYFHPTTSPMKYSRSSRRRRFVPLRLPFQHASAPVLRSMGRGLRGPTLEPSNNTAELPLSMNRSTSSSISGRDRGRLRRPPDFQSEAQLDWLGVCGIRGKRNPAYCMKNRVPILSPKKRKSARRRSTGLDHRREAEALVG